MSLRPFWFLDSVLAIY